VTRREVSLGIFADEKCLLLVEDGLSLLRAVYHITERLLYDLNQLRSCILVLPYEVRVENRH